MNLRLSLLPGRYSICRLNADEAIPAWAPIASGAPDTVGFVSITRTADELSIVGPESDVPEAIKHDPGWRILKVEGPLDLSLTGVLAALAAPLARARINVFAVSTFDTDYLLVKDEQLMLAVDTLAGAGHQVETR